MTYRHKRTPVQAAALLGVLVVAPALAQESRVPANVWVDQVLSVRSLVGGESPQWFRDGSRIMFASSLGGGGLWSISAEGGFPTRLASDLGSAGHFLARQMPAWSPDGRWIAYVSAKSGSAELWAWSNEDGQQVRLTNLGARINSFTWSPDSRWIAFGGDRNGNFDIWKIAVPGDEPVRLTSDARYEVYPTWAPDGRKLLYVRLDERWMDHEVIEIGSDGQNPRSVLKDTDFFDYGSGASFGYPTPSSDGSAILIRSQRSGWLNYWVAPMAGGAPQAIAAEPAEQSDAEWSPDGKSVAYVSNHNGTNQLRVVSRNAGSWSQPRVLVDPSLGVVANPAWSPDGKRLSYTLGTPSRAADLYVVNVADGASRQLTFSASGGGLERRLIVPEKISYRSDTLTINAYLYKPATIAPGERLPGIMLVHGGPTGHFQDQFELQAQFFAQQGYVLLLPNVRGSSGYGRAFEMANNKDWGHGDLKDVIAGVEYLKKLPYVNPEKMGITGSSYGGHLSTAAITWAPTVFQAAIPASGYPNRVAFMTEGEYRHIQQMAYEFGPFEQNQDVYRRNSPFFWIKDIQTPTFLLNGEGFFPESPQMKDFAAEMERYYKVFKYKAYPNENYYVRSQANTRQMLLDMLEFFDQYLKDQRARPPRAASLGGR